MAVACTEALFYQDYVPAIDNKIIESLFFYTLNDELEQADTCKNIYRKSLLYAISECLEPTSGPEKIIGMEIFAKENKLISRLKDSKQRSTWIISNGIKSDPQQFESESNGTHEFIELISKDQTHGGFSQDICTMNSVIRSIVGHNSIAPFTADDKLPL